MKDLSNPNHYVEKIPDFILLKDSRKEVQALKTEILSLNTELQKRQSQIDYLNSIVNGISPNEVRIITQQARREIKKEQLYAQQLQELNRVNTTLHKLKLINENLILEIIKLKNPVL